MIDYGHSIATQCCRALSPSNKSDPNSSYHHKYLIFRREKYRNGSSTNPYLSVDWIVIFMASYGCCGVCLNLNPTTKQQLRRPPVPRNANRGGV